MENDLVARQSEQLVERGFVVLEGLAPAQVQFARDTVLANAGLLKNTRPNPSSGHLAGFHRYPELEHLHALVSCNPHVLDILRAASGCSQLRSIGLSDITVNRSQEWHVDLLRGKYQPYLDPEICWGRDGGGVYKVLLYLQPGLSLRVMPGAHRKPIALDDDRKSQPRNPADTAAVQIAAGGIILMDIRLPHRGSSEAELSNEEYYRNPKILVSTVLGGDGKPLTQAMERGNFERMVDWDAAHKNGRPPRLAPQKEPVEIAVRF